MWLEDFFSKEDKRVKDKCPICKKDFGSNYIKTERVFFCEECDFFFEFHPYETVPKSLKKSKESNLNKGDIPTTDLNKYGEVDDLPPDYGNPDKGPRIPPWWI